MTNKTRSLKAIFDFNSKYSQMGQKIYVFLSVQVDLRPKRETKTKLDKRKSRNQNRKKSQARLSSAPGIKVKGKRVKNSGYSLQYVYFSSPSKVVDWC